MGNMYSNCEKKYNTQLATAFAVYMMAGSLFRKCVCSSQAEARHLYLHYREMPMAKQLSAEDAVLSALERQNPEWLAAMAQLQCEVRFRPLGRVYELWFDTRGFGGLGVCLDEKGRIRQMKISG